MGAMSLLAALPARSETMSQEDMVKEIYQAVATRTSGMQMILIVSIISLIGIAWLVHRQQRLARNQVKLAGILEEMAERSGK